jgi:hypothetical protein
MTITLAQLGVDGLRQRLADQELAETVAPVHHVSGRPSRVIPGSGGSAPSVGPPVTMGSAVAAGSGTVSRKIDAAQRLLIDNEDHLQLIVAEIYRLYETVEGRESVSKFAKRTRNVLQDTVDQLAVVYTRAPTRQFSADDGHGTEDMAIAWREAVLDDGEFDLVAESAARKAFFLNIVHVIPQINEDKDLVYETILPHAADVVIDQGEREASILVYASDGDGWSRVAVDTERYWYLDENWEVVREFEHGYIDLRGRPMRPWVAWRVRPRLASEDYWQYPRGRQLVDATLSVGVIAAELAHTRKGNHHKLLALTAPNIAKDVPPGQVISPEVTLLLKNGTIAVHDLVVPVDQFLADMDSIYEAIAESYGVTRGALDKSKSTDPFAEHTQIANLRDGMVKYVRRADMETSIKTAIIMRADGHRLTSRLDPKAVAAALSVKFQALTFVADPKDRYDIYAKELSLGMVDHVQLRMREHPDEDEATAERRHRTTVRRRNEFANELAKHQLSADATEDGESLDQRQGRIGGQATPDGDEDEDDERESDTE